MLSPDERMEWDAAVVDAWRNTIRPGMAGDRLGSILRDAIQAGRPWAQIKLDEALDRGLTEMAKAGRKTTIISRRGPVPIVLGVKIEGVSVQLSLDVLTTDQVRQAVETHKTHRDAANRNIWALRLVLAICDKHPTCAMVGQALIAEGTTLADLLEAAA
jgi:hypothetical protein